ncbi:941_t:CDS:2, partial [Funneliformis geosporum]
MEPPLKKPRKMASFTYEKPTKEDLNKLINNSRSKNTDYSTSTWVCALEIFRSDVKYQGLIEEITTKEELEEQL